MEARVLFFSIILISAFSLPIAARAECPKSPADVSARIAQDPNFTKDAPLTAAQKADIVCLAKAVADLEAQVKALRDGNAAFNGRVQTNGYGISLKKVQTKGAQ